MVLRRDLCLPAGLDHDGLMRLDDEGRAGDQWPGSSRRARRRRVVPGAPGEEACFALRFRKFVDRKRHVRLMRMVAAAERLDLDRLDSMALSGLDEAEALRGASPRSRRASCLACRAGRPAALSVPGSGGARALDGGCGARDALASNSSSPSSPRGRQAFRRQPGRPRRAGHRTARLARRPQFGEAHAVGREHAGQRMDSTLPMPSASATRQACCPPAPPKQFSA